MDLQDYRSKHSFSLSLFFNIPTCKVLDIPLLRTKYKPIDPIKKSSPSCQDDLFPSYISNVLLLFFQVLFPVLRSFRKCRLQLVLFILAIGHPHGPHRSIIKLYNCLHKEEGSKEGDAIVFCFTVSVFLSFESKTHRFI